LSATQGSSNRNCDTINHNRSDSSVAIEAIRKQLDYSLHQELADMANTFGTDILLQAPDPKKAANFYVEHLGFEISDESPELVSLLGRRINLFIERGPVLGPVLEVTVDSVEAAKRMLVKYGCEVVKDEPEFPRCYVKDPFGLVYNLTSQGTSE